MTMECLFISVHVWSSCRFTGIDVRFCVISIPYRLGTGRCRPNCHWAKGGGSAFFSTLIGSQRACGCGRAAHSTTHLIHSLDNNSNKTVVACSSNMVKKEQVKCIKEIYTNTQQTWSGKLVLWVVKVILETWVQIWLAWSSLSTTFQHLTNLLWN